MKKLHQLLTITILGSFLIPQIIFAQNINTDTTSTTVGSTQFGTVLNPVDLQTVMQSTIALTCAGPVDARVCTPSAAQGTSTAFVRVDQQPGSFTDSPTGTVSAVPNFACTPVVEATFCTGNMTTIAGAIGRREQTAPDFTGRQLVGTINSNIVVGDGGATAGMPDGFMAFTLDPSTGDATIDQFITHTINLGGGSLMVFNQREATIGLGNTIPDPIGGPLTLVPFTALDRLADLCCGGGTQVVPLIPAVGMVSRMTLDQGAADGFGALQRDVTTNFVGTIGLPGAEAPFVRSFVTPGLNTGLNASDTVLGLPVGGFFGPEWDGFVWP